MKSARIWFKKDGLAVYISHLDLMRCMGRAFHIAKIPISYTQGFNPHPIMSFSLPLSLGISGLRESMDIKLDQDIENQKIIQNLNLALPDGIEILAVTDPIMKASSIRYALFDISLSSEVLSIFDIKNRVVEMFSKESIIVEKKTKSGMKEINLKEYIGEYSINTDKDDVHIHIKLPAGSAKNINPNLIVKALDLDVFTKITRIDAYSDKNEQFI